MGALVPGNVALLGEALSAGAAAEGLRVGVRRFVPGHGALLGKTLAAQVACVGFIARVGALVGGQMAGALEPLPAVPTGCAGENTAVADEGAPG